MENNTQVMQERFGWGDIVGSLIIGEAVAVLFHFIAQNIAVNLPFANTLPFVFPILSVIGLYVAFWLNKYISIAYQGAKFALVGVLNTAVDFGVTNSLIFFTSIVVGWEVSGFKAVGFIVAVINSYFWNKYWTFHKTAGGGATEFGQFVVVSVLGFAINVGIATLFVNYIPAMGGLSQTRWDNVGFLAATILSLLWNFVGYKFWVFATRNSNFKS
ncbi:MAG: GtrA family protein [Candidatus Spechtbacteria bacterium]|nr:GtrA family protein [Candidatus Spechtbacteria bacterium]